VNVVVTGGSGQLGSLIVSRLVANRKVKRIVVLDRVPPRVASPKLAWSDADVRDAALGRHFDGADALVHLAFIVASGASRDTMRAVNVEGTERVFEQAAAAGVRHAVYASSVAAYGVVPGQPVPIVENTPRRPSPALVYADNGFEVEAWLDGFETRRPELRGVRLRPAILVGRTMQNTLGALLRRRLVPKLGSAAWPIVWDEDAADAALLALFGDARGAFNLVADEPLDAAGLARAGGMRAVDLRGLAFAARLGRRAGRGSPDAGWLEAMRVPLVFSSERARRELGWKPSCPTAASVMARFAAEVPRRADARIAMFLRGVGAVARRVPESRIPKEARRINVRLHLNVTGPRGGDFDVEVCAGRPRVRRGVPRPPDTSVTLSASTLLRLLAGKTNLSSEQMAGRVRVRGDPIGGFVLAGMIAGFRTQAERRGAAGVVARGLSSWFGWHQGANA
jgi:UDP-glucose 4-epimerase